MAESEEAGEGETQQPANHLQQGSESMQENGQNNGEVMRTGTGNEQQQPQELAAGMRVSIKPIDPKHAGTIFISACLYFARESKDDFYFKSNY